MTIVNALNPNDIDKPTVQVSAFWFIIWLPVEKIVHIDMFTMTIYITEPKCFLYFRNALDITKKVFQFQI